MNKMPNITYPKVSICMPTYNRNEFKPLMLLNLQGFLYPDKSLLEWVIDDDGPDKLFKNNEEILEFQKQIEPIKINYNWFQKKRSIGEKRNNLVKLSNYKHIAMMDSDDVYLPSYIQYSIELLISQSNNLVGTNQMIFLYPKNNYKLSCIQCEAKRQIHEATCIFTKKHHRSMGGFINSSQGEGSKMVDSMNLNKIGLTECRYVMLCVCHDTNTISKDQFKECNAVDGQLAPKLKECLDSIFLNNNV